MAAPFDFHGKVALVTGGSRGIGAGLVRALAAAGANCVINYVADFQGRNKSDAEALAAELPGGALAVQCDVGDLKQVTAMMDQVRKERGELDILVNNAGIMMDHSIRKMTDVDWDAVLRVNLTGAYHCIQQAAPALREGGRVVNIASVSAQIGFFGQANYAASKAGLIALTKVAARELASQHVTVNAIAPGVIDTEMGRMIPPNVIEKFVEQIPLGRLGQVADVVNAALFLCSPLSAYITGHVLHVNGGFYMQ